MHYSLVSCHLLLLLNVQREPATPYCDDSIVHEWFVSWDCFGWRGQLHSCDFQNLIVMFGSNAVSQCSTNNTNHSIFYSGTSLCRHLCKVDSSLIWTVFFSVPNTDHAGLGHYLCSQDTSLIRTARSSPPSVCIRDLPLYLDTPRALRSYYRRQM